MKTKLYKVDFEPMYPVGGALIILAYSFAGAENIAAETIKHTTQFRITEVDTKKAGVVVYLSGDY